MGIYVSSIELLGDNEILLKFGIWELCLDVVFLERFYIDVRRSRFVEFFRFRSK